MQSLKITFSLIFFIASLFFFIASLFYKINADNISIAFASEKSSASLTLTTSLTNNESNKTITNSSSKTITNSSSKTITSGSSKTITNSSSKTITNRLGMTFVYIPAGRFMMGSPSTENGREWNENLHSVTISQGFYIQETEVTQGEWKKLVGFNPSSFPDCGEKCPVDTVSWNQCVEFIRVLNKWEGTKKYRLPTEAEWEYACRARSKTAFANGDITQQFCSPIDLVLDKIAWYCGNAGYNNSKDTLSPHQVKTRKPNAWGIYDMHGNVQEWCMDSCGWKSWWFGRIGVITSTYKNNIVDPISKDGDHRVIRGGGWHQPTRYCRSAKRSYYKPMAKRNSLGFRIVKEQ